VATGRRYVHVFLYDGATAYNPINGNVQLQITGLKTFRDVAYESGNASILKADTVIKNARATAAPLLNQSDALISAGTFSIPEYVTNGSQSPKEIMEVANAYENYRLKIGGDDLRTLVYDPKPVAPLYEVGEWSGAQFADASVSGQEIYTKAVVEGTGPDGSFLTSTRTQTGTLADRQGFTRAKVLPISAAMTQAVADRFGDLYLAEHDRSPFSGKLTASSGIRRLMGGASVPPHELLRAGGEKIRLAHRLDPDTGGWGRDGRIAGVSYNHDTREVSIDIDDRRENFEEILSRYGVLVDQFA
jgi:hypothetical protein